MTDLGRDRDDDEDEDDPATWFRWADEKRLDDPLAAFLLAQVGRQMEEDQDD